MNRKLKAMMSKAGFAAYRLTENGKLEVLGRDRKVVEYFFLFDGKDYYFGNQFVQVSSSYATNELILALTDTKLYIPQDEDNYLYIARNFAASKEQCFVALYYYDNYIYYSVVTGNGSGRVHSFYLPFTKENYIFCFHFAIEAIAAADSKLAETLYSNIKQKCTEALAENSGREQ